MSFCSLAVGVSDKSTVIFKPAGLVAVDEIGREVGDDIYQNRISFGPIFKILYLNTNS